MNLKEKTILEITKALLKDSKQKITKVALKKFLKEKGHPQVWADDISCKLSDIFEKRAIKNSQRQSWAGPSCDTAKFFNSSLVSRLSSKRKLAVIYSAEECFKFDHSPTVQFTENPGEIGFKQTQEKDWGYYSKSFNFPKIHTYTEIIVNSRWRQRVPLFLRTAGDMLTLDAQVCDSPYEDINLYSATWLSKGRGYSFNKNDGFIAGSGVIWYHAKTAKLALAGARRKIQQAELTVKEKDKVIDFEKIADKYPDTVVSLNDARMIGACSFGIESWCNKVGIDIKTEKQISLHRMLDAYKEAPVSEARATILYAIRRQKINANHYTS